METSLKALLLVNLYFQRQFALFYLTKINQVSSLKVVNTKIHILLLINTTILHNVNGTNAHFLVQLLQVPEVNNANCLPSVEIKHLHNILYLSVIKSLNALKKIYSNEIDIPLSEWWQQNYGRMARSLNKLAGKFLERIRCTDEFAWWNRFERNVYYLMNNCQIFLR
jgi:hypothetical protein